MSLSSEFNRLDRVESRMTDTVLKKQVMPAYKQSLDEVRGGLATMYEKHAKDGVLKMADVAQYNRLTNLEKDITKEMSKLSGKQVRATNKVLGDVYTESYQRASFGIEDELQQKLRFGQLPEKQVKAAIVNPMDRIGWPDRTREQAAVATRQIKEEITRGIIQGKSYPDVARAVKGKMDMAAGRAERIVRTEAHRAREMGKMASLEHAADQGIIMEKMWVSALDDRTRESHQELDGQTVPVYDEDGEPGMFESPETGETAEYPGGFGSASEDINCRCTTIAQLAGEEYAQRRTREDGVIDYKNYKEYAKDNGWKTPYDGPEPRVPDFRKGDWGDTEYTQTLRDADRRLENLRGEFPVSKDSLVEHGDWLKMQQNVWDETFDGIVKDGLSKGRSLTEAKRMATNAMASRPTEYEANYAGQYIRGRIGINPKTYGSNVTFDEAVEFRRAVITGTKKGDKQTLFNVAKGHEGTTIHEYGHALMNDVGLWSDSPIHKYYGSLTAKQIEEGVSYYASTNVGEFFAECFTEAQMPNPRPIAVEFMRILRKLM